MATLPVVRNSTAVEIHLFVCKPAGEAELAHPLWTHLLNFALHSLQFSGLVNFSAILSVVLLLSYCYKLWNLSIPVVSVSCQRIVVLHLFSSTISCIRAPFSEHCIMHQNIVFWWSVHHSNWQAFYGTLPDLTFFSQILEVCSQETMHCSCGTCRAQCAHMGLQTGIINTKSSTVQFSSLQQPKPKASSYQLPTSTFTEGGEVKRPSKLPTLIQSFCFQFRGATSIATKTRRCAMPHQKFCTNQIILTFIQFGLLCLDS